jgi:zinc/manganese transport system ATP-binding protein
LKESKVAVHFHDLTVAHQHHPAVHHLSGHFARGSLTAIVGPNGAGKSSLLDALMGRIAPAGGRIEWAPGLRERVAYLPQQSQIDRSFPLRVIDMVMLGHWGHVGAFRAAGAGQRAQAADALGAVGLRGFEQRLIGELSVGQFQRLLFARLLLQDAQLILLDEPFNAIDARTCAELLAVVARWHAEQRTVVAVLHDMAQVQAHFPTTLLLAREAVAWGPTAQVLTADNLARARQMAEHWDEAAPWCGPAAAHEPAHSHPHPHPHPHAHEHAHADVPTSTNTTPHAHPHERPAPTRERAPA